MEHVIKKEMSGDVRDAFVAIGNGKGHGEGLGALGMQLGSPEKRDHGSLRLGHLRSFEAVTIDTGGFCSRLQDEAKTGHFPGKEPGTGQEGERGSVSCVPRVCTHTPEHPLCTYSMSQLFITVTKYPRDNLEE